MKRHKRIQGTYMVFAILSINFVFGTVLEFVFLILKKRQLHYFCVNRLKKITFISNSLSFVIFGFLFSLKKKVLPFYFFKMFLHISISQISRMSKTLALFTI